MPPRPLATHFVASLLFACALSLRAVTAAEPLTIEDLFGPAFLRSVNLSPDGTRIAATVDLGDDLSGLLVHDLATKTSVALKSAEDEDKDVYHVYWHGNDRLLFSVSKDKLYAHGLYSVPADKLSEHIPIRLYDAIDLVAQPVSAPDRVVIWTRQSVVVRWNSVSTPGKSKPGELQEISVTRPVDSAVNISHLTASTLRTLPKPTGTILGFAATPDGEVAFAGVLRDGKPAYAYWDRDAAAWKNSPLDPEKHALLASDFDPAYTWGVTRDPAAGSQLRRIHLPSGTMEAPVYQDARFDLRGAAPIFSRKTRELIGVSYDRQRAFQHWFTPKFAEIHAAVKSRLPADEDHVLIDWDLAETRFLVRSLGPRQPGVYRVYDPASGTLEQFGERRAALAGKALRPTRPVQFTARDGLALEGYLTTPANLKKESPAPVVVLVHGGPWARDTADFDAEVQFLASRGYAVLQPNYRGSSGYLWPVDSDDYKTAFTAMRDDVIDATRALLKNELFDPDRVAIMGGSFGGYLALACSVEEPTLYRGAVSVCGVFDWAEHVKSKRRERQTRPGVYEWWVEHLGDPKARQADYEAISPLHRVDRLRIPMLIAHGKADSVVSIQQSRRLVRELKARDLPHETFFEPLAGHGFYAAKDRIAFYRTVERFLATHLRVAGAPAGHSVLSQ